jgi:hypothetical protein|nr:MAG: hypothetical protein [Bacteriophage sp.]UVY17296.1 MAG: hypothetical protein [Bacteriophage sp.]UWD54646.1 MAG: hypothetical protein [Bacteriophage sp.]UWF86771.1 MAG: hypothetical protein [Bacteriophage sp.]
MIKSLKDTPYWNIWADCCSLHKKFHGTSETDDTKWTELINEAGNIRNKYKNLQEGDFAEQMVLLVSSEISRCAKGGSTDAEKK